MNPVARLAISAITLAVGFPLVILAQATAGSSLFGTVTDPGGSPIPDAAVKITSATTNAVRSVTTNTEGNWVAPQLLAGTYSIPNQ
jgi:hypothetical protein